MKPHELLERFRTLAQASRATDAVLIAPVNPTAATDTVHRVCNYVDHVNGIDPHVVTSQDLMDFVKWVDRYEGRD